MSCSFRITRPQSVTSIDFCLKVNKRRFADIAKNWQNEPKRDQCVNGLYTYMYLHLKVILNCKMNNKLIQMYDLFVYCKDSPLLYLTLRAYIWETEGWTFSVPRSRVQVQGRPRFKLKRICSLLFTPGSYYCYIRNVF